MADFDVGAWLQRYPELAARGSSAIITQIATQEVPLLIDLTRFNTEAEQTLVRNLATAHVADITLPGGGTAGSQGLVGRISSASEGSVSVSLDAGQINSSSQAYWSQTRYGQQLWQMCAKLRTFRYVPGRTRVYPRFNPVP